MDDFYGELERTSTQLDLIMNIVTELPDCVPAAFTIISMVIDKYAAKHNLRSSEVWKVLIDVSSQVHDEMGDCK